MKLLYTLITLVAALGAATTLQAQTLADKLPPDSRWSVHVETGGGLFHGLTTSPAMSSCRVESIWNLGADYQLPKGLHLGGEVGYMRMKWNDTDIVDQTSTIPNYEVNGYLTTLNTRSARMDNRHNARLYQLQLHADYDWMHRRSAQKHIPIHLFTGIGMGYIHAKAQEEGIWAYKEEAISQTDHNLTIYSHAYVEHVSKNSHWNALHLAIPVKAYYDLCPHLSIYAKAEYKVLIFKHSEAPQGLLTASIGLQFHLGAK